MYKRVFESDFIVLGGKMDAIKKKMQAMKVEKDNAMDRYIICNGSTH